MTQSTTCTHRARKKILLAKVNILREKKMQKSHFLKGNRPETEHPKPEKTQKKQPLLKIEGKNHHADGRAFERLRENLLRRVVQIRTLFVEHIPQSETEFQFRYQLEKGR